MNEAENKARQIVEYFHSPSVVIVEVIEQGNKSTAPSITLTTVNEDFDQIEVFSVDAGTEFLWAVAAVVGCFSMILIPSFTVTSLLGPKSERMSLNFKRRSRG